MRWACARASSGLTSRTYLPKRWFDANLAHARGARRRARAGRAVLQHAGGKPETAGLIGLRRLATVVLFLAGAGVAGVRSLAAEGARPEIKPAVPKSRFSGMGRGLRAARARGLRPPPSDCRGRRPLARGGGRRYRRRYRSPLRARSRAPSVRKARSTPWTSRASSCAHPAPGARRGVHERRGRRQHPDRRAPAAVSIDIALSAIRITTSSSRSRRSRPFIARCDRMGCSSSSIIAGSRARARPGYRARARRPAGRDSRGRGRGVPVRRGKGLPGGELFPAIRPAGLEAISIILKASKNGIDLNRQDAEGRREKQFH